MSRAVIHAALDAHRFNKALGTCACGWESLGRGTRSADHRSHLADVLTDRLGESA